MSYVLTHGDISNYVLVYNYFNFNTGACEIWHNRF